MKTHEVPRELEAGSEPMELERKRPLDPEEPRVGLAPWETAGQRSVAAEVHVEQMPGSRRGKSAWKPRACRPCAWRPGSWWVGLVLRSKSIS